MSLRKGHTFCGTPGLPDYGLPHFFRDNRDIRDVSDGGVVVPHVPVVAFVPSTHFFPELRAFGHVFRQNAEEDALCYEAKTSGRFAEKRRHQGDKSPAFT